MENFKKGKQILSDLKAMLKGDQNAKQRIEKFNQENLPPEIKKDNDKKINNQGGTWHDKYDNY